MLTTNDRAYVLNGMGTGKTRAALWAWDYLNQVGDAKKLLVVAPVSTLNFTWAREVFTTLPRRKVAVLHGDKAKRLKALDSDADVYIINHAGIKVIEKELALRKDIDTLVLDELAVYRNGQSKRTKEMREFAKRMKWVWGMTGSPTPRSPVDAWGQCTIVTPHTVPKAEKHFRDLTMIKLDAFRFMAKDDALDHVYKAMQPAVRYTLDDIIELPDVVERTVDVDLSTRQAKVYSALEKTAHAALAEGTITAVNAGVVLNKLLQVSLGYVYTSDDRRIVDLDASNRIEATLDIIESAQNKVIVFVPYKHAIAGVVEALTKHGIDHAVVNGDVSQKVRSEIFATFQGTLKYRVLVAHPECMAHGLTLTAADTIVWFGPTTNLEIFEQANARIRRIGQKAKQQIIMLQSTRVEKKTYRSLREKKRVQDALLDMFVGDN